MPQSEKSIIRVFTIEKDGDNDLKSPNEVSREALAQTAKSGGFSPLNVSPKVVYMLATALPTSTKSQNSRSALRSSSKTNSIAPSANLNPNTQNTYNSPSVSPGLKSPEMGSSSSTKALAKVTRSSPSTNNSELCKINYVNTIRPS